MIYKYFKYNTPDDTFMSIGVNIDPCPTESRRKQIMQEICEKMGGALVIFLDKKPKHEASATSNDLTSGIHESYIYVKEADGEISGAEIISSNEYKHWKGYEFMPPRDIDSYDIYVIDEVKEDNVEKILHEKGFIK